MKKIVALVLAMVMVLGLATTAFAAKGGMTYADAKQDYDWDYVVTAEDDEDAKDSTFATYTIEATAKKDGVDMWWTTEATETDVEKGDKEDVEIGGEDEFVKVTAGEYDFVIVDGKTITYYAVADKYNEDGFAGKAVKVTLPVLPIDNADRKCNTLYANSSADTTFYYYDGQLWNDVAVGEEVLNYNGTVLEAVAGDVKEDMLGWTYWEHDFELEKGYINHTNVNGNEADAEWGVTKVYCQNCKAEFKFVETNAPEDAVAVFGEDNYERVLGQVYIELIVPSIPGVSAGTAVAPEAGSDKVESPKTFDAGIAMYVGMSVMAAAGSAVVLKKKD